VFFLMFIATVIFALAGPRMGSKLVREFRRGCDIVLAIDISRSMNIRDARAIPGSKDESGDTESGTAASRLERSLWIAKSLIEASGNYTLHSGYSTGDEVFLRFALALGKGSGVLAVPLSNDAETLFAALNSLSASSMTSRGTNLEQLLDAAVTGFVDTSPAGRQIILFSDGETLSGSISAAAERAARENIPIIAVGAGSTYGALVPSSGESAAPGGGENTMVRSYLHEEALRQMVERAGGVYIDGNANDAVNQIIEKVFPRAKNASWMFREEASELWHFFVLAALAFLALSALSTQCLRTRP
jgi:Ca-activated chloride channel family protein